MDRLSLNEVFDLYICYTVFQATGDAWARTPNSGAYDVERAAKAAKKAFPAWAALSYEARAEFMMKVKPHRS